MLPVLGQLREKYPDNTVQWESESMSQLVASRKKSSFFFLQASSMNATKLSTRSSRFVWTLVATMVPHIQSASQSDCFVDFTDTYSSFVHAFLTRPPTDALDDWQAVAMETLSVLQPWMDDLKLVNQDTRYQECESELELD
jgi:hypothetical protein